MIRICIFNNIDKIKTDNLTPSHCVGKKIIEKYSEIDIEEDNIINQNSGLN